MTTSADSTHPLPDPESSVHSNAPPDANSDAVVQSAIRFLQDQRVQRSPLESQIRFLKGKSLTDAQIKLAFEKVGRPVTLEKVQSARPTAAAPSTNRTENRAMSPQLRVSSAPSVAPITVAPMQTRTLFPPSPLPEPEAPSSKVDWRDVVIGVGAAVIASVTGYKLFNRYSPFEIRRKSDKKYRLVPQGGPRRPLRIAASSESEAEYCSVPQRRVTPPLPPVPNPTEAAPTPSVQTEELQQLQTELTEAKEALSNERRKSADLAVSAAKIRSDKQQLSRANDRLSQQIEELKKQIEKLEEAEKRNSGPAPLTATEEEPPFPINEVPSAPILTTPTMPQPVTLAAPATEVAPVTANPEGSFLIPAAHLKPVEPVTLGDSNATVTVPLAQPSPAGEQQEHSTPLPAEATTL